MKSLPLKLLPGSDLRLSIEELGRQEKRSGFVLGVVGNLSRACFQCPGRSKPTTLEGNLEIITLNGTFNSDGVHLHLSISDGECQVWGGHLELGSKILKGADILVGFIDENQLETNFKSSSFDNPKHRLEIAVMPECPWSTRAIRLLRSVETPHHVQIIDNDEAFKAIKERSGMSTFPQIFLDGNFLGGYEALNELHKKGKLSSLK